MQNTCLFCGTKNNVEALECRSCKKQLSLKKTPSYSGAPKPPPAGTSMMRPSSPSLPVVLGNTPEKRVSASKSMVKKVSHAAAERKILHYKGPLATDATRELSQRNLASLSKSPPALPPSPATFVDLPPPSDHSDLVNRGVHIGNFRLVKVLGFGGMGAVYLGEHIEIGKRVAIKILKPQFASEKEALSRFLSEAKLVTKLRHPSIVDVYDSGVLAGIGRFLVMEHLQGYDLHNHINQHGALSPFEAASIGWQVLDALEAAHEAGVVHRDLKPSNIHLVRWGRRTLVKLLDFGVAKLLHANPDESMSLLTRTGVVVGTPAYMAPEQAAGVREPDSRMDLYAFGVILFEMVTGRRPFLSLNANELMIMQQVEPAPPPSAFAPGLTVRLEKLILACLEKVPEDRPPSAGVLKEELGALLPELSKNPLSHSAKKKANTNENSSRNHRTPTYGLQQLKPPSSQKERILLTDEAPLLSPAEVAPSVESGLVHPPQLLADSIRFTQPALHASPRLEKLTKPKDDDEIEALEESEENSIQEMNEEAESSSPSLSAPSTSYIRMQELREAVVEGPQLKPDNLPNPNIVSTSKQKLSTAAWIAGIATVFLLLVLGVYLVFFWPTNAKNIGLIQLDSIPRGAEVVTLDNNTVWGKTPLSISVPKEGVTLRMKLPGYVEVLVPLSPESPETILFPLTPAAQENPDPSPKNE